MTMYRRSFLKMTAAFGVLMASGVAAASAATPATPMAYRLVAALDKRASAAAVGRAYLKSIPGEPTARELGALIESALQGNHLGPLDGESLGQRFATVCRREFEREEVAVVDGWVLSSTEARLCALAATV